MHEFDQLLKDLPVADGFFEGFEERFVDIPDGQIFCRIKGNGPPLLMLHGYPQTSAIWHLVAPKLAEHYTVICADLRGYGRSHKPATAADHYSYSKRAMGNDMIAVMDALGFDKFLLGTHDRGSRVAHRMALDHEERVIALATLDIAPTREMYRDADSGFAQTYWHWYWLTQPAPFPETLIGADSDYYVLKKCGGAAAGMKPFYQQSMGEYLKYFRDPASIHACCEDYRAGYSIDIAHDDADNSRKVKQPLLAMWGANGAIEKHFDCMALWHERAENARGHSLPGAHYLAEEVPDLVIEEFLKFFTENGG